MRTLDREILRLAVPALGALAAEPLYVLADTAVVGHISPEALAGLAGASSILLVGYAIFIFLAYGTTASVARLLGAGDEREAPTRRRKACGSLRSAGWSSPRPPSSSLTRCSRCSAPPARSASRRRST